MMTPGRSPFGQVGVALRAMIAATILLGVLYPLAMTGAAQVLFRGNANGSMVRVAGHEVGSDLIGQTYTRDTGQKDAEGNAMMAPDPRWFQSRPSAVDYDAMGSAASQYGPNNPELLKLVEQRRAEVAKLEGVDPAQVPPDAVTASGSGLDPHISPAYAAIQVRRIARERGLSVDEVQRLVERNTTGRTLGFLGQPTVNVVTLNRDLAEAN